jgi:predicted O-methyltransferase YrrM
VSQERWSQVDDYFAGLLIGADPALDAALAAAREAGLPSISVSPAQGKLLHLLARMIGARRILEIGTLAGYSTIWLARALAPGGRLITLEADPMHARVARGNLERAGVADLVDLRVGLALETLPELPADPPFDFVFIDADKVNTIHYFEWALRLARPGALVVVDNVVRNGAVADPDSTDPSVQGMRRFNERLAAEPRVSATALQTVGSKGYDGFVLAVVES